MGLVITVIVAICSFVLMAMFQVRLYLFASQMQAILKRHEGKELDLPSIGPRGFEADMVFDYFKTRFLEDPECMDLISRFHLATRLRNGFGILFLVSAVAFFYLGGDGIVDRALESHRIKVK